MNSRPLEINGHHPIPREHTEAVLPLGWHLLTLMSRKHSVIKVVPEHNILKVFLIQGGIHKMLLLRSPNSSMNFASRLPTNESSHFPIDKSHDSVIVHNTIGLGKIIVHKAQVRFIISVGEDNLSFQRVNPAITENIRILDNMEPSPASVMRLDGMQLS